MTFNDGVKSAPVAYIGLVSVLVTLVLVMALQVLYYSQHNAAVAASLADAPPPVELSELTSQQLTALTQRGYVDRQRGIVSIGIDRAMELVLKDLAAGKSPQQVIGPLPQPAQGAEPGTTQPPAAGESPPASPPPGATNTAPAAASGETVEADPEAGKPAAEAAEPESQEPTDEHKS